jgi:single-strand DNA-binding protein
MANFNLNKVIIGGRLTADPELKVTQSDISMCSFSIAINRKYAKEDGQQQTDFIRCKAWRNTADFISRYFRKGSSICVVGEIQTSSWTDQSGNKSYSTDILVNEALFVDSKNESQGAEFTSPINNTTEGNKSPQPANFEPLAADDDLPF